jgi:hypothetical protein
VAPLSQQIAAQAICKFYVPGKRRSKHKTMWLMSQEQGLWAERPPEMREGARRAVKPPVAKRKVARKAVKPPAAKRRPRAQAGQDFASNGFLALPVAKEAAKPTIAPERTETRICTRWRRGCRRFPGTRWQRYLI